MQKISNFITRYDLSSYIVFLIAGFIFLNPFPHVTALKEIFFYSTIFFIILAVVSNKGGVNFRSPLSKPFLFIFLWSAVDLLFAINKMNSLHDIYAHLIKYFAVYFMIINYFASKEKLNSFSWTILLSSASFCVWSVSYFYLFLGHPITQQLGIDVFQEIPTNIIGIITVFNIILSLQMLSLERRSRHRLVIIFILALLVLATLLTQTRSAFLALFLALAILSFRNRFILVLIITIFILASFLPVKNRLTPSAILDKLRSDSRINISYTYIEVIKDFPLQGIGFGLQSYADEKFMKMYHDRTDPAQRNPIFIKAPHNFVIDIMVRLGIVGLALYLYALYWAFRMITALIKDARDDEGRRWGITFLAALVAFLIQGMFENVHSGPPAVVFYTLLAMITIFWRIQREDDANDVAGHEKGCTT